MPDENDPPKIVYDLFISYAHVDDLGENAGKVTALVKTIEADYSRVTGKTLRVFFDVEEIRAMHDWETRIHKGLRESKMMVAVLSPHYFASAYCKKEWEAYVETELYHALPGEGITPIYVIEHPAFDVPVKDQLTHWLDDLRRRQYIKYHNFWDEGAAALEREDVRRRFEHLPRDIADRLQKMSQRDVSHNDVPLPSKHFVGRRAELQQLRRGLMDRQIGAITAVNGIAGIGKSMLAFAYAWGYGYEYPGGRFLINAANLSDLATAVIGLADRKGVVLTDDDRKGNTELALNKVKAAFDAGPAALLVIDNLDDPTLLGPVERHRCLPGATHVHVLVTTRVSPDDFPGVVPLPLDSLTAEDALRLLASFRPILDAPQDDEWKAALEIANRLEGHALALEVVGVYLKENPGESYREFATTLEREGIAIMEEEVGPAVKGRLTWHAETCIARLLEPTLIKLEDEELRAVEYAAILPSDIIPLPWLRSLLLADFPELAKARIGDKINTIFQRLERLRLLVPQRDDLRALPTAPLPNLARMHRLIQAVLTHRATPDAQTNRQEVVHQFASDRLEWIGPHWGQPGLAWEIPPLRDLVLRMIDQGDRRFKNLVYHLDDPLVHIGRPHDARTTWLKAAEFYKSQRATEPENPDDSRELSVCYNRLGDLAVSMGEGAAARRYFEDGLAIAVRLSAASPENAGYARDLSVSYNKLGDLAVSMGEGAAARRYFEDYLAIAVRLSAASPENAGYARDLSISYNKLGDLAVSMGEGAAARRYFEDGLAIRVRLSAASPENAQYARDLSISYNKLGDLAVSMGEGAAARRYFEDGLAIAVRLSAASPENAGYARDLSISYDKLGNLAVSMGEGAAARRYFEDGLAIAVRLSAASPENAEYARDLSISYNKLGDLAVRMGEGAAARRYFEDYLAIAVRLSAASPENAQYARDLSVSYNKLGDLAVSMGEGAAARRYFEDGLAIRVRLSAASPENAQYARDLSISYDKLGDLAVSMGEGAAARRYFEDGLAIRVRLSAASPENAQYARDLSISYNKLGDLAVSMGEGAAARRYFEDGLAIAVRLSAASPENAQYARDLSVSHVKIAGLIQKTDADAALEWWRRAWEILAGMKRRGLHLSPGDQGFLKSLEETFGFGG